MYLLTPFFRLVYWIIGWRAYPKYPKNLKKSVTVVAPHTSNWDFMLLVLSRYILGMPNAKFMAKKVLFDHALGKIFYWLGGIPVDRSQKTSLVEQMVAHFARRKSLIVTITPEGTRKLTKDWKSGFYHIALGAKVPLALGFIDFEKRQIGIGKVFYPSGNYDTDLAEIKSFYQYKVPFYPTKSASSLVKKSSRTKRWMNRFFSLLRLLLVGLAIYLLANLPSVIYGLQQAYGQVKIMYQTQAVSDLLAAPTYPDSLKSKIRFIEEVKKFTVSELGLDPSGSYERLFEQDGKPILWVLTASKPFSLEAKIWHYPIFGKASYKGFFDRKRAIRHRDKLATKGWDTRLGIVNAWSTLGILNDPILSNFLHRDEADLANLIIHELTHGTIFIKNNIAYNENLADFVADEGTKIFLEKKYGKNAAPLSDYLHKKEDRKKFSTYILKAARSLDSLYQSFPENLPEAEKKRLKTKAIGKICQDFQTLTFSTSLYQNFFEDYTPNNAFFIAYRRYRGKQNQFKTQCKNDFSGNLRAFIAFMKKENPSIF